MGAAVRNFVGWAAPNEGLKPYWDERIFYVGQVAVWVRIDLSDNFSDQVRKNSYNKKRI